MENIRLKYEVRGTPIKDMKQGWEQERWEQERRPLDRRRTTADSSFAHP